MFIEFFGNFTRDDTINNNSYASLSFLVLKKNCVKAINQKLVNEVKGWIRGWKYVLNSVRFFNVRNMKLFGLLLLRGGGESRATTSILITYYIVNKNFFITITSAEIFICFLSTAFKTCSLIILIFSIIYQNLYN